MRTAHDTPDQPNDDDDPFRPPDEPILVHCLKCGGEYLSSLLEWRDDPDADPLRGFWCCPNLGCDGKGYGLDIGPIEP
jgi:hypothetical protein